MTTPVGDGVPESGDPVTDQLDLLNPAETDALPDCERVIERGIQVFADVGRALMRIRDERLYHFRGYRAGLTPAQVAALDLPSTLLKDTECRADRWLAAWGVEQTELDALAALAPEEFQRLAQRAVAPFADLDLDRRVDAERARFLPEAQAMVDAAIDHVARPLHAGPRGGQVAVLE